MIFEDLHWADSAILAFVQYLAEWSTSVPMLILCTARPELFESHPAWAGGLGNATTVALRPLASDDTQRLARSLLRDLPISQEVELRLVDRCGGNPLYAEEYARLLAERTSSALTGAEMPDTIQALIAARIDTLDGERKALLYDAAVMGKVFWAGALVGMGNRDSAVVHAALHELSRKELIKRSRVSSVPGDEEYSFWHDLVHDVAYRQIPRAERADKHCQAAEWIRQMAGERVADRAEILAYHYAEAVALRRASGHVDDESLRRSAVRFGRIAAEHTIGLDLERATQLVYRAIDLAGGEGEQMAQLLCVRGTCLVQAGALEEASCVLKEAHSAAISLGDTESLADAMFQQIEAAYFRGDGSEYARIADEILERFEHAAPTSKVARVIGNAAFLQMLRGDYDRTLELVERQLAISEEIDDPLAAALAINTRGLIRSEGGDEAGGRGDLERSLAMFQEHDPPYVTMGFMHLAGHQLAWRGPAAAAATRQEGIEHGRRTRNSTYEMLMRAFGVWHLFYAGAWDDMLEAADAVLAWAGGTANQHATLVAPPKAYVLALRGDAAAAKAAMIGVVDRARAIVDPQIVVPAVAVAALLALIEGEGLQARNLAAEAGTQPMVGQTASMITEIARILIASGRATSARPLAEHMSEPTYGINSRTSVRAMLAETGRDTTTAAALYDDAAQRWRLFGHPYELAHALAGHARCLHMLGNDGTAEAHATEAAALFRKLGVDNHVLAAIEWPVDHRVGGA